MKTIWKYELKPNLTNKIAFDIPEGAEILTLQVQNQSVCIWALVDTNAKKRARLFEVYGTGHELPEYPMKYIGTFQVEGGALVFHVFERSAQQLLQPGIAEAQKIMLMGISSVGWIEAQSTAYGTRLTLDQATGEIKGESMGDWISVEDRMPISSTPMETHDVWAYYRFDFPGSEWTQGLCRWFGQFDVWRSNNSPSEIQVSHWMPLPEPPVASNNVINPTT